jgi:prevent-host-death family protein
MERAIDVTTVRQKFGTLLDEVYYKNDVIIIERKGKPMARIIPIDDNSSQNSKISLEQQKLLEELNGLPTFSTQEPPTTTLREKRIKKRKLAIKEYGK